MLLAREEATMETTTDFGSSWLPPGHLYNSPFDKLGLADLSSSDLCLGNDNSCDFLSKVNHDDIGQGVNPAMIFVEESTEVTPITAPFDITVDQQQQQHVLKANPVLMSDGTIALSVDQVNANAVATSSNIVVLNSNVLMTQPEVPADSRIKRLSAAGSRASTASTSKKISLALASTAPSSSSALASASATTSILVSSSSLNDQPLGPQQQQQASLELRGHYGGHNDLTASHSTRPLSDQDTTCSSTFSPSTINDYDLELDQIVDDVDDMFREQQQQNNNNNNHVSTHVASLATNDLIGSALKTKSLIRKNTNSVLANYLSRNAQDIAEEIAKSLVERALESDRRKLLRSRNDSTLVTNRKALNDEEELVRENYVEVAANRVMEALIKDMIDSNVNDVTNLVVHACAGSPAFLPECREASGAEVLQNELEDFVNDIKFASDSDHKLEPSFGLLRNTDLKTTDEDYLLSFKGPDQALSELNRVPFRWRGTNHLCSKECDKAVQRLASTSSEAASDSLEASPGLASMEEQQQRQQPELPVPKAKRLKSDRRKRNALGLLLSSLEERVYHCRCIDCQAERKAEGKPEPEMAIEVRQLQLPELPETVMTIPIPQPQKRGRGRPRKFPRLEDLKRITENGESGTAAASCNGFEAGRLASAEVGANNKPKKRKRGRPRKEVRVRSTSSDSEEFLDRINDKGGVGRRKEGDEYRPTFQNQLTSPTASKSRPVRACAGKTNLSKLLQDDDDDEDGLDTLVDDKMVPAKTPPVPGVRRKRGRPRKQPPAEQIQLVEPNSSEPRLKQTVMDTPITSTVREEIDQVEQTQASEAVEDETSLASLTGGPTKAATSPSSLSGCEDQLASSMIDDELDEAEAVNVDKGCSPATAAVNDSLSHQALALSAPKEVLGDCCSSNLLNESWPKAVGLGRPEESVVEAGIEAQPQNKSQMSPALEAVLQFSPSLSSSAKFDQSKTLIEFGLFDDQVAEEGRSRGLDADKVGTLELADSEKGKDGAGSSTLEAASLRPQGQDNENEVSYIAPKGATFPSRPLNGSDTVLKGPTEQQQQSSEIGCTSSQPPSQARRP